MKQKIVGVIVLFLFVISLSNTAQAVNVEAAQAYNKALDLYIAGNTNESIDQFEAAIKLDPTFADAYYNLGSIYRYNGNLDKAEEAFLKVNKLKQNDTGINYDLALIYIQKNDLSKALTYLKLIDKSSDKFQDAQTKISFLENELNPQISTAKIEKNNTKDEYPEDKTQSQNTYQPEETTQSPSNNINLNNTKVTIIPPTTETDYQTSQENVPVEKLSISSKKDRTEYSPNNSYKDSKFWQQYNVTNSNSNTIASNVPDDENLPVNYAAISEDRAPSKLKITAKTNKNDLTNPTSNNEKLSRNQKKNNENTTRAAVKTFATGLNGPTGMAKDSFGNFYIANYIENKIYVVSPNGNKKIFACSDEINGPIGMAIDKANNLYVASYQSNSIVKISPDGFITTIATGLNKPYFLYIDSSGKLYVTEQDSNSISEINLSNKIGLSK